MTPSNQEALVTIDPTDSDPGSLPAADLSGVEQRFMQKIASGFWVFKAEEITPGIQSLVDRGYCRIEKVRFGLNGHFAGDVSLHLTEEGKRTLAAKKL